MGASVLERARSHRRACGVGSAPWGRTLGLTRRALTPGARQAVGIAGAVGSFAEAASVALRKLSGPRASESTTRRACEATGRDIGRRLAAGEAFGSSQAWPWHEDAEGETRAYVSLELAGPRMQGPDGAAADGRMAAVAMACNPVPEGARGGPTRRAARRSSGPAMWPGRGAKRPRASRSAGRWGRWAWIARSVGSP